MYRLITVVVKESILSFHLNNIHLGVIQTHKKGLLELVRTLFSVQAMYYQFKWKPFGQIHTIPVFWVDIMYTQEIILQIVSYFGEDMSKYHL